MAQYYKRFLYIPFPTLTKTLDQYVVITLTLICALVSLQGITIQAGFEPAWHGPSYRTSLLNPVGGSYSPLIF